MKNKIFILLLAMSFSFCIVCSAFAYAQFTHNSYNLQDSRFNGAVASSKKYLYYAGGTNGQSIFTTVDIFSASNSTWSQVYLITPRSNLAATSSEDGKIFFGGGSKADGVSNILKSVEIFDQDTNEWSYEKLSSPRTALEATSVGSKVLFAGGHYGTTFSIKVDVFDINSKSWTTSELSEGRDNLSAITVNNKAYFAGGFYGN